MEDGVEMRVEARCGGWRGGWRTAQASAYCPGASLQHHINHFRNALTDKMPSVVAAVPITGNQAGEQRLNTAFICAYVPRVREQSS